VVYNCAANNDVWQSTGLNDLVRARVQQCSNAQAVILAICNDEDKMKVGLFATEFGFYEITAIIKFWLREVLA
jgi:hypothetical protein